MFIIWQGGKPSNFELKLDYRISEDSNSGINYRSESINTIPNTFKGYQVDIDGKNDYTGQIYEERKRTALAFQGGKVYVNPLINLKKKFFGS
ncbi:family 16 glycoside hydrolase [Maribacter algicola]|uniref:family 16 glycoside hydrolase n=1 Tax=Maribacter algicola TaxID=2498892 RepID=UPI001A9FF8AA|nr:family 16 glycoside hydrolase [Maribacter algicola]